MQVKLKSVARAQLQRLSYKRARDEIISQFQSSDRQFINLLLVEKLRNRSQTDTWRCFGFSRDAHIVPNLYSYWCDKQVIFGAKAIRRIQI